MFFPGTKVTIIGYLLWVSDVDDLLDTSSVVRKEHVSGWRFQLQLEALQSEKKYSINGRSAVQKEKE